MNKPTRKAEKIMEKMWVLTNELLKCDKSMPGQELLWRVVNQQWSISCRWRKKLGLKMLEGWLELPRVHPLKDYEFIHFQMEEEIHLSVQVDFSDEYHYGGAADVAAREIEWSYPQVYERKILQKEIAKPKFDQEKYACFGVYDPKLRIYRVRPNVRIVFVQYNTDGPDSNWEFQFVTRKEARQFRRRVK